MNALLTIVVVALAVAGAAAEPRPHKDCFGASDISCSGYPQTAIITHSSLCTGQPQPDCQVVSASYGKYVEALQTWWSQGQPEIFCHPHSLARLARQVSAAIAEVWSSAKARVSCEDHGEACGYTLGSADDYAEAISETLAQAAARVVAGDFCYADLRATASSLVEALAEADHRTCERGSGSLESWRLAYMEAVAPAVEVAFAAATASTCTARLQINRHLTAMPMTASQCISAAGTTQSVEMGNVCAGIDQDIPECEGDAGDACCGQDEELSHCACENCNGPWLRKSGSGSSMRIFQDVNKHRCTCKFTDKCEGAPDYGCDAFSKLEITATSGKCTGEAKANCATVSQATDAYRRVIKEWFSEDGAVCSSGKAEAAAKAIAEAAAAVYTDAAVSIKCEGEGFGCGWAQSNGAAWAKAFSEAVAIAVARAHDPSGNNRGMCYADIRAMSSVVARASAKAQAKACSTGAAAEDYKESIAESIARAVSDAFATASANSCIEGGNPSASSKCEGEAESKTEADLSTQGEACAGLEATKACIGGGKDMCCSKSFTSSFCFCDDAGCNNSPWIKSPQQGSDKIYFKDGAGTLCFCV